MYHKILVAVLLICSTAGAQQSQTPLTQLSIGDKLPPLKVSGIINAPYTEMEMTSLAGKGVILDFWGLTCRACIRNFDKIDALQKKYKDRLQIIAVNEESREKTLAFFEQRKNLKQPGIPFVTGDTVLSRLFPYVFLPHHVWIDTAGIVRYITNDWNLHEQNIEEFLAGNKMNLSEKKYVEKHGFEEPLLSAENGKYKDHVQYYSLIATCISGVNVGLRVVNTGNNPDKPNRITQNCSPPAHLFRFAYSENFRYNLTTRATIVFEGVDTSAFVAPSYSDPRFEQWYQKNFYTYDLVVPEEKSDRLFAMMQDDLKRYFGVDARMEKRKIPCLVLKRTGKEKAITVLGDTTEGYHNTSMRDIIITWNQAFLANGIKLPLVNGTGFQGILKHGRFNKARKPFTPAGMNPELRTYGLEIVEKNDWVDVVVIRPRQQ